MDSELKNFALMVAAGVAALYLVKHMHRMGRAGVGRSGGGMLGWSGSGGFNADHHPSSLDTHGGSAAVSLS